MEYRYTKGEITRLIAESSNKNEFKPVIGDGVESKDKSENGKAYNDAKKRAKDFDKGGNEYKPSNEKPEQNGDDFNGTTLGAEFNQDPGKDYKDRVAAQAEGYTSVTEKNNKVEKDPSAEFSSKSYDMIKDREEDKQKAKADRKGSGLVGSEMEKHNPDIFKKDNVFKENTIKTVSFKHTKFINEEHMISRIPDELKNEGQVFHMIDNADNDYTVKWNLNEAEVLNYTNKRVMNESFDRMKSLWNYNPNSYGKYKKQ